MSTTVRKIDQPAPRRHDWRSALAESNEASALVLDRALDHLHEAEAVLEGRQDVLRAIATLAAYFRTIRNDLIDEADRLRAAVKTREATQ